MKKSFICLLTSVAGAWATVGAVVIAPGNGVTTNVARRITGSESVSVNPTATGGGIVTLNPLNTYTGDTELGSGTLVLGTDVKDGAPSSVGSGGGLSVGAATLRYEGPAGGTFAQNVAVTSTEGTKGATVFDVRNDLDMTGTWTQPYGAFVKTGPGTLTLSGDAYTFASSFVDLPVVGNLVFNPNGDGPTTGHGGFVLAEGAMIIGEKGGTYEFSNCTNSLVGTCTVRDGQEKSALLEIRGGTVTFPTRTYIGYGNGTETTAIDPVRSGIRITDGTVNFGHHIFLGTKGGAVEPLKTEPFLEIAGGTVTGSNGLHCGYADGVKATFTISGGKLTLGTKLYIGYGTSTTSGATGANALVDICGGDLQMASVQHYAKTAANHSSIRIRNGSRVYYTDTSFLYPRASTYGSTDILIDNGALVTRKGSGATMTNFTASTGLSSVSIGTGGAEFYSYQKNNSIYYIKSMVSTNTGTAEAPVGVFFRRRNDTTDYIGTVNHLCAANSWEGPTRVGGGITLSLEAAGALPPTTSLVLQSGKYGLGTLVVAAAGNVVRDVKFGTTANYPSAYSLVKDCALHVTEAISNQISTAVQVTVFTDAKMTKEVGAGSYTILTAPVALADSLRALRFERANPVAGQAVDFRVVEAGGLASVEMRIQSTADAADVTWTNGSTDGQWATAGNWSNGVQPGATKTAVFPAANAGTVNLGAAAFVDGLAVFGDYTFTGAALALGATGFNPALLVDKGASARFDNDVTANRLFLAGGGTVTFAKPAIGHLAASNVVMRLGPQVTALPNFTTKGVVVLDHATDLALQSVEAEGSLAALVKAGTGTLSIAGNGTFRPGNEYVAFKAGDEASLSLANGAPASMVASFSVAEGSAVIGTGSDAPTVVCGDSILVGRGDAQNASLTLNSGSLEALNGNGYFILGAAMRNAGKPAPTATLTVNGGSLVSKGSMFMGYDPSGVQTTRGSFVLNGGEVVVGNHLWLGEHPGVENTNVVVVNGGTLTVSNDIKTAYIQAPEGTSYLTSHQFIHNGGVVKAKQVLVGSNYGGAFDYYLNEGARLVTSSVLGNSSLGNGVFHANGGVLQPYAVDEIEYLRYCTTYIGEKGLVVEANCSEDCTFTGTHAFHLFTRAEKEPSLGDRPDGGVTIRGTNVVELGTDFCTGNFGDIRVEKGAKTTLIRSAGVRTLSIASGASFRGYGKDGFDQLAWNLTLGTAGDDAPVQFFVKNDMARAGLVVSNEIAVLAPVLVAAASGDWSHTPVFSSGSYTALVYRAEQSANVDVGKFRINPSCGGRDMVVRKVTLSEGDAYAGWEALVVEVMFRDTVKNPDAVWTSTRTGGTWTDNANWNPAAPLSGSGAAAAFRPAETVGVPVMLDEPVRLGRLAFTGTDSSKGYTLSGEGIRLQSPSGLGDAVVTTAGDTATIDVPVELSSDTAYQTGAGGMIRQLREVTGSKTLRIGGEGVVEMAKMGGENAASIELGNTTLRHVGAPETAGRLTLKGSGSGRAAVLSVTDELTLTGGSTASFSAFIKAGPGTLTLAGRDQIYALGSTYVGFAEGVDYRFGPNGEPPAAAFSYVSVAEGTLAVGSADDPENAPAYVWAGADSRSMAIGIAASWTNDATLVINNGCYTNSNHLYFGYYQGFDYDGQGERRPTNTLIVNGGKFYTKGEVRAQFGTNTQTQVGSSANAAIIVNGGEFVSDGAVIFNYHGAGRGAASSFVVNGGTARINGAFRMGYTGHTGGPGPTNTLAVNGGTLDIGSFALLSFHNNNTLNAYPARFIQNGGQVFIRGYLCLSRNKQVAEAHFNGGEFAFERFGNESRVKHQIYLNGGTLAPLNGQGTNDVWSESNYLTARVSTNGLVLSTARLPGAKTYTICQPLVHDPDLAGVDGGVTKVGEGVLILSAANTYTGPTRVAGGSLRLLDDVSVPGEIIVSGGVLDLGGDTRSVSALTLAGNTPAEQTVNGVVRVTGRLALGEEAGQGATALMGDLVLADNATIALDENDFICANNVTAEGRIRLDFGRTVDDPMPKGELVPVFQVSGEVPSNLRFTAVNAGQELALETVVEGDTVSVRTRSTGGLTIYIR